MNRKILPYEVKNALIDVCGRSFWYKQPLFDMFSRAGIQEEMYLQYEHEAKFTIARRLLGDLESMGDEGLLLQRRLVTELCRLRNLPDNEVPDKDAGLHALRNLKKAAHDNHLLVEQEEEARTRRATDSEDLVQKARERQRRLGELFDAFVDLSQSDDTQSRGYALEDLLKELFALSEIRYRKSYRGEGEQVDGFFSFGGFDYLVEARWRKEAPTFGDLSAIRGKVARKVESTRGFVVSIPPFRSEILQQLREEGPAKLVFMDGYDLTLILEGRISLIDALQAKADKAAQEGMMHFPQSELFG